jgi:hypothetical protein
LNTGLLKGSINLAGSSSGDFLTLYDSNWSKTLANGSNHPTADAGDSALSVEPSNGIALRSGNFVSDYVNTLPDGANWLSRLYPSGQAWAVPHYGIKSIGLGLAPIPLISDVSSATVWAANTGYPAYYINGVIWDGANFQMAVVPGTSCAYLGDDAGAENYRRDGGVGLPRGQFARGKHNLLYRNCRTYSQR